ncbi:hypothetical protein SAMN04488116_0833 [Flagellimonas flava]|uniref:Secreted protein n=2 Tax=Flagellimonas flava TaxID=570519 RepID=A0A1M5IQ75_9FLAO|nr:hypothetical protein SAMN04488116_0833 [Allomuricauda flava]
MKTQQRNLIVTILLALVSNIGMIQAQIADEPNLKKESCTQQESTSGCSPTSCRGAKTKFGEAKVIGKLRLDLIDLKADMEKSVVPAFDPRSYDIHGIVGETDEESLDIIVKEVQIVEKEIAKKLNPKLNAFALPESKAGQIQYLSKRIQDLRALL